MLINKREASKSQVGYKVGYKALLNGSHSSANLI